MPRDTSSGSCRSLRVRMPLQIGYRLPFRGIRKRNRLTHLDVGLLLQLQEILFGDESLRLTACGERNERPLLAPLFDLRLVTIELRVEHRVRAKAIRAAFQKL